MTDANAKDELDVVFVGKTGVGKSSLINMILGHTAAGISNDACPCTQETTSYPMSLGSDSDSPCRLWDTRGLDEATDNHDRWSMTGIVDRIRQARLASQQARELKVALRDRIRSATPILVWCMDATKIEAAVHWEQFRRIYTEICEKKAIPVVVLTRMHPKTTGWEGKCSSQLEKLGLRVGTNAPDVRLLRVRNHRDASSSSPEYNEDSEALKDLISSVLKGENL